MIKKIITSVLKYLLILIALILILVIVNLIPRSSIESNVKESLQVFLEEGAFPKINHTYNYLLDNYTDALMINTAYSTDSNEPLKSAMLMRRNYRPDENMELDKIDNENNTIKNLNDTLIGENRTYYEYSRYWHGYIIYLRPLLVFFNYSQIRIILTIIIISLSITLLYLAYKRINLSVALSTLLMLLVGNFCFIGMSLQYSSTFIIMLITSMYIILRYEKIKEISSVFFIVGILTSFFDLLTTPLITLGIPAIYYMILRNNENKDNLKKLVNIVICWGLGYGIVWISKWIISDCLYQTGTITRAMQKIALLSASKEQFNQSAITVINRNIIYINATFFYLLIILAIIFSAMNKDNIKEKIPYVLMAIIPFIWYILIKNHSYVHARFTHRNLLLTVFSLSIIILENVKEYLKISNNNKIK